MRKFLYLLLLLLVSCSKKDELETIIPSGVDSVATETGEGYEITFKYKEGVLVYDEDEHEQIIKTEEDSILYLSSDAPSTMIPVVGDIISSRISSKLPYGLGNRVISVTEENGMYKCITTLAPLDEIFEELEVKSSIVLMDTVSTGIYDNNGYYMEVTPTDSRASIGGGITINLGHHQNDEKIGPTIRGSLYIGSNLIFEASLKKRQFKLGLDMNSNLKAQLGIRAGLEKEIEHFFKPNIITGVVPIGPIVLRPSINLRGVHKPYIDGYAAIKVEKNYSFQVGLCENGIFTKNMTQSVNTGDEKKAADEIIKEVVELDVNGGYQYVVMPELVAGIYTTNVAVGFDLYAAAGVTTDFRVNNYNIFRDQPTLDFTVNAGVDAAFVVQFFGKSILHQNASLVDWEIFKLSLPLLPNLVENSLSIEKRESDQTIFDAKYSVTGGLLPRFFRMHPAFIVYKGDKRIKSIVDKKEYNFLLDQDLDYELSDLKPETHYHGRPALSWGGKFYEEDGKPFSTISPTAAITDVVQTSSAVGSFPYNGYNYKYTFKYYVNAEIIGSDFCEEWGLYSPTYIKKYAPMEQRDGRQTQYWTGYANTSSVSFTQTPYAQIKGESNRQFYETRNFSLTLGGTGSRAIKDSSNSVTENDGLILVLDSIVYKH